MIIKNICTIIPFEHIFLVAYFGSPAEFKIYQGNITAEFVHTDLEEEKNVFVYMSMGFIKKGKVLKLNRTIYGFRQSIRAL